LAFAITIIAAAIVWRLFKSHGAVESHWYFLFGIYSQFVDGSVSFSNKNRLILKIMIQIFVFTIFVLANIYQGVVTSFATEPIEVEHPVETLDDLFRTVDKFLVPKILFDFLSRDPNYKNFTYKMEVSGHAIPTELYKFFVKKNYAIDLECSEAKARMSQKYSRKKVYIMKEKMFSFYRYLEGNYVNPFMDRFQLYMDRAFEGGLTQHWINMFEFITKKNQLTIIEERDEMLRFDDVIPLFIILPIGYGIAVIIFLLEIFHHDFVRRFPWKFYKQRVRNRFNSLAWKKMKVRKQKYKVRRIQVRSINSNN
jgi:hypothetical protein